MPGYRNPDAGKEWQGFPCSMPTIGQNARRAPASGNNGIADSSI